MPYIPQWARNGLDSDIKNLADEIRGFSGAKKAGWCNYAITKLLMEVYDVQDYATYNEILGILAAVTQELYRRKIAPYEDEAKMKNGDVF